MRFWDKLSQNASLLASLNLYQGKTLSYLNKLFYFLRLQAIYAFYILKYLQKTYLMESPDTLTEGIDACS